MILMERKGLFPRVLWEMIAAPNPLAHSNLSSRKSCEEGTWEVTGRAESLRRLPEQSMGGCYQMLEEIDKAVHWPQKHKPRVSTENEQMKASQALSHRIEVPPLLPSWQRMSVEMSWRCWWMGFQLSNSEYWTTLLRLSPNYKNIDLTTETKKPNTLMNAP